MFGHILTQDSVTVVLNSKTFTATRSHENFDAIVQAIKDRAVDVLPGLFNIALALKSFCGGKIKVDEDAGVLFHNGSEVHNVMVSRILTMMKEGFDVNPMANFLDNLMQNPEQHAREELYLFLETGAMPITEDGCFLAYKKVKGDYTDCYTGTFDNSIGQVLEMERSRCDSYRHNTCSDGFHFCSLPYLSSFGGEHIMIVKINPRDVVSIPSDYNNTKGRCCRYEVVGEHKSDLYRPTEAFTRSVHSDDEWRPGDTEDDDDEIDFSRTTAATQEFIDDYNAGYRDGRNRATMTAPTKLGYQAGYSAGRGKKKRLYREGDIGA
jgi:hypothetical protein